MSLKNLLTTEGTVNKVEKDYIGVIVLGIFNAAIAFSDIREDLSYQDNVRTAGYLIYSFFIGNSNNLYLEHT